LRGVLRGYPEHRLKACATRWQMASGGPSQSGLCTGTTALISTIGGALPLGSIRELASSPEAS
jgi:hypothetical protein